VNRCFIEGSGMTWLPPRPSGRQQSVPFIQLRALSATFMFRILDFMQ
jgi:hypothetical protein